MIKLAFAIALASLYLLQAVDNHGHSHEDGQPAHFKYSREANEVLNSSYKFSKILLIGFS